jgi:hypothetical protein
MKIREAGVQGFWKPGFSLFNNTLSRDARNLIASLRTDLKQTSDPKKKADLKQKTAATKAEFRAKRRNLYVAKALDDIPTLQIHPSAAGQLVWSANSRVLALKSEDHFIAYVDTGSGESGRVEFPHGNGASEQQKAQLTALNTKIESLLRANTE